MVSVLQLTLTGGQHSNARGASEQAGLETPLATLEIHLRGTSTHQTPGVASFLERTDARLTRAMEVCTKAVELAHKSSLSPASAQRVSEVLAGTAAAIKGDTLARAFDMAVHDISLDGAQRSECERLVQVSRSLEANIEALYSVGQTATHKTSVTDRIRLAVTREQPKLVMSGEVRSSLSATERALREVRNFIDYELPGSNPKETAHLSHQTSVDGFVKSFEDRLLRVADLVTDTAPHPLFRRDPQGFTWAARVGIESMLATLRPAERERLLDLLIKSLGAPDAPRINVNSREQTWLDLVGGQQNGLAEVLGAHMGSLLKDLQDRKLGISTVRLYDQL